MSSTVPVHTDLNAGAEPVVYYPWFDWLRAVLAITVMMGHDGLIPWRTSGDFAVKVFFALSGWLICGVLLRTERAQLPRFFFNRAVRIWAPYYLALVLLLAASLLREPVTAKWLEIVFYKMTFAYNWFGANQLATSVDAMPLRGTGNHFATVNAEEQFYLLAPILLVLLPARFGRSAIVWMLIAIAAWLSQEYASIAIGVAAAVVAHKVPNVFASARSRVILTIIAICAAYAIVVNYFPYQLVSPILAICIVLLLAVPGPHQAIGTIAGGMSYPLYLNHWIGVFVANFALKPFGLRDSVLAHVVSNLLNIAIAVALYLYFDRRLLQRRAQWYTPVRGRWITIMAYSMVAVGLLVGAILLAQRSQ